VFPAVIKAGAITRRLLLEIEQVAVREDEENSTLQEGDVESKLVSDGDVMLMRPFFEIEAVISACS
jgi:hypothetical protein